MVSLRRNQDCAAVSLLRLHTKSPRDQFHKLNLKPDSEILFDYPHQEVGGSVNADLLCLPAVIEEDKYALANSTSCVDRAALVVEGFAAACVYIYAAHMERVSAGASAKYAGAGTLSAKSSSESLFECLNDVIIPLQFRSANDFYFMYLCFNNGKWDSAALTTSAYGNVDASDSVSWASSAFVLVVPYRAVGANDTVLTARGMPVSSILGKAPYLKLATLSWQHFSMFDIAGKLTLAFDVAGRVIRGPSLAKHVLLMQRIGVCVGETYAKFVSRVKWDFGFTKSFISDSLPSWEDVISKSTPQCRQFDVEDGDVDGDDDSEDASFPRSL